MLFWLLDIKRCVDAWISSYIAEKYWFHTWYYFSVGGQYEFYLPYNTYPHSSYTYSSSNPSYIFRFIFAPNRNYQTGVFYTKSRLLVNISVLFMDIIMLECNNQALDFAVPLSKILTIEKSVKQIAPKPASTRAGTK